nr:uncharacterized protein LOC107447351 [Parasteatoda tepidariorum]
MNTDILGVEMPENDIVECEKQNCYPACYEEHFEVTREVTDSTVLYHGCPREPAHTQNITIFINLDGMKTTTYTYNPKFQNVEAFSNIGGYVGIWLGISLVAVYDFLETVILIISYPFKRYKKAKVRNGKLEKIKKLSRDM